MQRKAAVFLILAVCQMAVASAEPYDSSAPLVRSASPVPGEYLVVMKKGGSDRGASIRADVSALNAATISDSRGAVDYLLVKGTEAQMRLLSRNPNVVAIEENGWYGIQPSPRPTLPDPSLQRLPAYGTLIKSTGPTTTTIAIAQTVQMWSFT